MTGGQVTTVQMCTPAPRRCITAATAIIQHRAATTPPGITHRRHVITRRPGTTSTGLGIIRLPGRSTVPIHTVAAGTDMIVAAGTMTVVAATGVIIVLGAGITDDVTTVESGVNKSGASSAAFSCLR